MIRLQKIIFILIILLFASCKKNENDIEFNKDVEFNRNVLAEILPSIVDSVCRDVRIYSNPPPRYGKLIFNKEGHYVKTDSTKATSEEIQRLKKWKKEVAEIKKDTSKVIIAFDPKIKTDNAIEYILNFKSIKLNGKFKLKNINEFPKENIFERKYNFNFSGILKISGIKFDKKRENGSLNVGYTCGGLCGYGNIIVIKKVKNKWKIIKMEETWIS
ncbi:hypothetical protein [Flavobacterium daemonense]|uniref:hypothetical protein n=1 Tax=Flavobacterium daemonense TaxID=1393049 RepID=UPI001185985C|nr:hypothetical protein [Flavobacterium daemonense]KAF2328191.1 hypothetical protein FND99_17755 [Flavobacterium daemonense]